MTSDEKDKMCDGENNQSIPSATIKSNNALKRMAMSESHTFEHRHMANGKIVVLTKFFYCKPTYPIAIDIFYIAIHLNKYTQSFVIVMTHEDI